MLRVKEILTPYSLSLAVAFGIGLVGLSWKCMKEPQDDEDEGQEHRANRPAGIYNEGNTCFVNSLLQALASVGSFQTSLRSVLQNCEHRGAEWELLRQLLAVIECINRSDQNISVVVLLDLIGRVKEDLINLEQQDAHELYTALVSCLQEVMGRRKTLSLSRSLQEPIDCENAAMGFTRSSIVCTSCRNESSIRISAFNDLSLQIHLPVINNIQAALQWLEHRETVTGWTCTNCSILKYQKTLTETLRALHGETAPKFREIGYDLLRYVSAVDYKECELEEVTRNLDNYLRKYNAECEEAWGNPQLQQIFKGIRPVKTSIIKQSSVVKYPRVLVLHLKQLVVDPYTGQPVLMRKRVGVRERLRVGTRERQKTYVLTSLLTHMGNQQMGHYFTFRKMDRHQEAWYFISDSETKQVAFVTVEKYAPYMLFYELAE